MHAASPLTSSSHAHDDEVGCHRLAAGGGLGGLRATSFISSDRSLLRDTSNAHDDELGCHRLAAGGGFGRPHHTQTASTYTNTHRRRLIYTGT